MARELFKIFPQQETGKTMGPRVSFWATLCFQKEVTVSPDLGRMQGEKAKALPSSLLPACSPPCPSSVLCSRGSACGTAPGPGFSSGRGAFPPAQTVKTQEACVQTQKVEGGQEEEANIS